MPVRYPPDRTPSVQGPKGSRRSRIVAYSEPSASLGQRLRRRLFSAPVIIPLVFLGTIALGVLIYYWTVFSGRIDNLLAGEVFTRSAGIYAAPKQLHVGEALSQEELIAYLKRAGYVETGRQAEATRGHYSVVGSGVEIEPSLDSS
ncbi:MAG TPA: hypothetical protein VJ180_06620, partial [Pyrinomonadaceae bacterium]|nr:hypothetical protein [Pyrinomonadaceae bacterium]